MHTSVCWLNEKWVWLGFSPLMYTLCELDTYVLASHNLIVKVDINHRNGSVFLNYDDFELILF